MSSKINNLNPIPVYGYHKHGNLQCNTPMSAANCRMRTQDSLQTQYNKIHYPTDETEGFSNLNVNNKAKSLYENITDLLNYINPFKLIEGNENMNDNTCAALIKAKHEQHQLPSFSKSKVSPIDSNSNTKLVNELYLKQCFDSQYDGDVANTSHDTLIQNQ